MTESSALKRSDARRNRDAILAAALEALTESPNTSLNAIAKRAGVANATVYRHFPTREELVLATYQHEVRTLVDAADSLLQEQAPIDALRSWVARLARYAVTKHGLADALRKASSPGSDLSSTDTYRAIVAALDRLLQANIATGTLRPDFDAEDVILALAGLWQLNPASDWRAQAQRVYDIVLSGLQRPTRHFGPTQSICAGSHLVARRDSQQSAYETPPVYSPAVDERARRSAATTL